METKKFILHSEYSPTGDQPNAIKSLTEGIEDGLKSQVLVGVTGSGKTFTMANVIANVQRPTLVIAHNKTLAAQLCNELREFFPENRVEYFVSKPIPLGSDIKCRIQTLSNFLKFLFQGLKFIP